MLIKIDCYCDDIVNREGHAELSLDFSSPSTPYEFFGEHRVSFGCQISVKFLEKELGFYTVFGSYSLVNFIDGLKRLHTALSGTAELFDEENMTTIRFKVLDREHKVIGISGAFGEYLRIPEGEAEDARQKTASSIASVVNVEGEYYLDGGNYAITTILQGLKTDHANLPEVIRQFKELLQTSNSAQGQSQYGGTLRLRSG